MINDVQMEMEPLISKSSSPWVCQMKDTFTYRYRRRVDQRLQGFAMAMASSVLSYAIM